MRALHWLMLAVPLGVGCGAQEDKSAGSDTGGGRSTDGIADIDTLTGINGAIYACIQACESHQAWKDRCGLEIDDCETDCDQAQIAQYSECYPEMTSFWLCWAEYNWESNECDLLQVYEVCSESWDAYVECIENNYHSTETQ